MFNCSQRQAYSWRVALRSVFEHHNESGNIWSHLIPTIVFGTLSFVNCWRFAVLTPVDDALHAFTVIVYTVGAMNLCLCSTAFHILSCTNEDVYVLTGKTGFRLMILMYYTRLY
jgi:adiponectin receptor